MSPREEEIQKLIKIIKSLQSIVKTSTNPSQVERVKKDLTNSMKKLKEYLPDFDPTKETIEDLQKRMNLETTSTYTVSHIENGKNTSWDTLIPFQKASEHSNDNDINFLYSVLQFILKKYWPILNEQHIQLDFTHSQERQSLRLQLDEVLREMNSLIDTFEDYAVAETPDFREQLYKLKNRQARVFIINSNEFFKKLRNFIIKLIQELDKQTYVIKNPNDKIEFNPNFEEATLLNGYTIRQALTEFSDLIQYILKKINLPDLKPKKI